MAENIGWNIYIDRVASLSSNPYSVYSDFTVLKKEMINDGYTFPPLSINEYDLYWNELYNLTVRTGGMDFFVFTHEQIKNILAPVSGGVMDKSNASLLFVGLIIAFIFISEKAELWLQ